MHFTSACAASDVESGEVEADQEDDPRSPAGKAVHASKAARGREKDGQAPWAPFGRPGLRRRDAHAAGAGGDNRTRPWDLVRRKKTEKGREGLLVWPERAGIVVINGDTVSLAPDWLNRLETERELGEEVEMAEIAEQRYKQKRSEEHTSE